MDSDCGMEWERVRKIEWSSCIIPCCLPSSTTKRMRRSHSLLLPECHIPSHIFFYIHRASRASTRRTLIIPMGLVTFITLHLFFFFLNSVLLLFSSSPWIIIRFCAVFGCNLNKYNELENEKRTSARERDTQSSQSQSQRQSTAYVFVFVILFQCVYIYMLHCARASRLSPFSYGFLLLIALHHICKPCYGYLFVYQKFVFCFVVLFFFLSLFRFYFYYYAHVKHEYV